MPSLVRQSLSAARGFAGIAADLRKSIMHGPAFVRHCRITFFPRLSIVRHFLPLCSSSRYFGILFTDCISILQGFGIFPADLVTTSSVIALTGEFSSCRGRYRDFQHGGACLLLGRTKILPRSACWDAVKGNPSENVRIELGSIFVRAKWPQIVVFYGERF